jgi:TetR/AcrR family transcriptional repressor of nem operon
MGRRTSYEREDVIRRALALFASRAFHSISIREIVDATSLNRFAIYEKFGGKRDLFEACLDFHRNVVLPGLLGPLRGPGGGFQEVVDLLTKLRANNLKPELPVGCIVVNASLEFGGADERVEQVHEACRAAIRQAFARALQRAEDSGELALGRSVAQRAEHLQTIVSAFMALQHVSRVAAEDLMRATIAELLAWRRVRAKDVAGGRRPKLNA